MEITLNGVKYWQHCTSPDHNCYIRPMPTVIKGAKVSDLLKKGLIQEEKNGDSN